MGKAFEKQTKTIEDQGKKQFSDLKSLESLKPKELKPKEAKLVEYNDKGLVEIRKNNQPIDFNDLTYNFKGTEHTPINFIKVKGPNHIFKSTHDGDIDLEDVENELIKLKSEI